MALPADARLLTETKDNVNAMKIGNGCTRSMHHVSMVNERFRFGVN